MFYAIETPVWHNGKKESVEFNVYLSGGSGKPKEQINNTPHLYEYVHEKYI